MSAQALKLDRPLLQIFSYLDVGYDQARASGVSKRWHRLSLVRWKNLTNLDFLELFAKKVPNDSPLAITSLCKKCTGLKSVRGPKRSGGDVLVWRAFFRHLPQNVNRLNLFPAHRQQGNTVALFLRDFHSSPNGRVTDLSIGGDYVTTSAISDYFPSLQRLNILGSIDLVKLIAFHQLTSLEVSDAPSLIGNREVIRNGAVMPCKSLTRLKLIRCNVDEEMIRFFARVLPSLQSLTFESCVCFEQSPLMCEFKVEGEKSGGRVHFSVDKDAAKVLKDAVQKAYP